MSPDDQLTRRALLTGAGSLIALLTAGCSRSQPLAGNTGGTAASPSAAAQGATMIVYRDPNCGCCEAWAQLARDAGFEARIVDEPDMASVKRRLGVPEALASCHTAVVGDFVIEGHVPFEQVSRVLRTRPSGVRGLGVPGMPLGSPGMEVPGGRRDPYRIFAFDAAGRTRLFFEVA